jgi:hypothetical protein
MSHPDNCDWASTLESPLLSSSQQVFGGLVKFRVAALAVSAALVVSFFTPAASGASEDLADGTSNAMPTPRQSGQDCVWGTEPAQVIPAVDYAKGYPSGDGWRRDNQPPVRCAIGPAWTPLSHRFPYSHVLVNGELYGIESADTHLCTGLDDPTCGPAEWDEIYAESVVGYCHEGTDFNCVESIEVIGPDGQQQRARYLRGFPETQEIPEFSKNGMFMPAGGSVPLWEFDTPGGPARLLSVGMSHTVFRPENGRWGSQTPALFTFALRPVAIESRPGLPKPVMTEQVDPRSGATRVAEPWWAHPSAVDCIAVDLGECALERTFPEEYRYRVTFRMRDAANMYLNGAVDDPIAYSEKIAGGHRFVIEAAPSPVLGMAGWIPKSQIPKRLVDDVFAELGFNYNWDPDFDAASFKPLGRGGVQALAWLKALMPYFGDRASFIADAWYVENTPTLGQYTSQCVNQGKGEFIGIVSSNATAYTGDPPTYDAATSTLKYEVAGPHYMPDGTTLSRGRYSINMNANFVKCLLGVDKVPSVARVELTYPDGEASAATMALKQDKNWLRLYYENFTFSSSTVSVKFPKKLICTKGKKSKTVVAFSCPRGWKAKG